MVSLNMNSSARRASARPASAISEDSRADAAGVALSALCLAHCLALPLFASIAPLLSPLLAHSHIVHWILLALAMVTSWFALRRRIFDGAFGVTLGIAAGFGFGFLASGAWVHGTSNHSAELVLTITGASVLAMVHLVNAGLSLRRQRVA